MSDTPDNPILTEEHELLHEIYPKVRFIWKASPNACVQCRTRNGRSYDYNTLLDLGRPHPNCRCTLEVDPKSIKQKKLGEIIYPEKDPGPIMPILPWNIPEGIDIKKNIQLMRRYLPICKDLFLILVRPNGRWDYKTRGSQYEDFGNFNYGATGRACGFSEGVLLRAAGTVQIFFSKSRVEWGSPLDTHTSNGKQSSYGDDPRDQEMIRKGIKFYEALCKAKKWKIE